MAITVNTNLSSLICQRSLSKATSGMNTALQRMSTGLKINSAKDDAAGCAISSKMDYQLSSYSVAQDNAQMGQSMIDTASGSVSVMTSMLQRMRDLSEQAANGTYGTEERKAMQAEVDALTDEIYRIKNTTDFNGKKILGTEEAPTPVVKATINMSDITDLSSVDKSEIIGISSADDLAKLATLTNNGGISDTDNITKDRTFVITNDIDLSSIDNFTAIGTSNTTDWTTKTSFQGTFDGNGYTISNLTINKPTEDFQGLFGAALHATIQNVNLENVNLSCKTNTGGLVGWNNANSTISNCSASGSVKGNGNHIGGLVGLNQRDSTITNCSAYGSVEGVSYTGGIVGSNWYTGKIINCSASGMVNGNDITGGLVGWNNVNSTIDNSWCSVDVTGTTNVGGFVGRNNNSNILNCSYDKAASGLDAVGSNTGTINPNPLPDVKTNPLKNPNKIINNVNLQVGINSDSNSVISVDTGFKIGDFRIALTTEDSARKALDKIDTLMAKLNAKSLDYGATSNRLASTMEFQNVQMTALTGANSLIKDSDIAKESASYIKNQILQQTTATLLATANQNPSIALSLV